MATSHTYDIANPACVAFLCASSQRVMNFGTRGSLTHQDNIPCWRPIILIASTPILVAPSWLRRYRRVTCLKRVVSFLSQTTHVSSTRERTDFFPTRLAVWMAAWRSRFQDQFFLGVGGWRCCHCHKLRGHRPRVLRQLGRTLGLCSPPCGHLRRGLGPWRRCRLLG